jgi:cation-transporting P-type ATPase I
VTVVATPHVVHELPGRLRIRAPEWAHTAPRRLEERLRELPGVDRVRASADTGNVLVCFDATRLERERVLAAVTDLDPAAAIPERDDRADEEPVSRPSAVVRPDAGPHGRARITVSGLDRDPETARRVEERLEERPEVARAEASPLTGRVLIEFSRRVSDLDDLLNEVAKLELPPRPGEDRPRHPLDPAPLVQSSARLIGASLGLALLAARRAIRTETALVRSRAPAAVAGAIGIAEGLPPVRAGLRAVLGHDRAQLAVGAATIVSLTLAGSPVGLVVTAASALRLLTEVRARRAAWSAYEERLSDTAEAVPGATVRLEAGDRVPLRGTIVEGSGTAICADALPDSVCPGAELEAGARVFGGPFVVELRGDEGFTPQPRPAPAAPSPLERYASVISVASLAYAGLTFAATRSLPRAFTALLLTSPRSAFIGAEGADTAASARVLRAGATVVGTRPDRPVRLPDMLIVDGPRTLAEGVELARVVPIDGDDPDALADLARAVASAAGSPWGRALSAGAHAPAADGTFDGEAAWATVDGRRYRLGTLEELGDHPAAVRGRDRGEELLALCDEDRCDLAVVALRPRLAPGVEELVRTCRRRGVEIALLEGGDRRAARAVAGRAKVRLVVEADLADLVRENQRDGGSVAVLSDSAEAAEGFDACDLAVALTTGRTARFPARADLLAPDLHAVAAIVEAGARRDEAIDVSVALAAGANVAGAAWGLKGAPGIGRAGYATHAGALGALAGGYMLLRGGERPRTLTQRLVDPRPERWGRRAPDEAMAELGTRPEGLTSDEVARRRQERPSTSRRSPLIEAVTDQVRSPLTGVLAAGAAVSLALGAVGDVAMIAAAIGANIAVGTWQERQAGRAAEALERLGAVEAKVLRDGEPVCVPADEVVPGDVLLLGSGDRVVADARVLDADALEVDEAALTGESFPVAKAPDAPMDADRVVLEGSDVTVGSGKAVVVAVGAGTRLGATAAALAIDETQESPLGRRLGDLFQQGLPVLFTGGALVTASGLLWGKPLVEQLTLGASLAIAAVPEGLPLLAGVAQAGVARRLAQRNALVRRLAAVEALGRVDVAACDKTGTLTEGRLAVTLVAGADGDEARFPDDLPEQLRDVLQIAGLASPAPDDDDAEAHPTDVAVVEAARAAGAQELDANRTREAPFDPARAFHAAVAAGRLCVKGAAEELVPRCTAVRNASEPRRLDDAGRQRLLTTAQEIAERGLRVLLVCEGSADGDAEDPHELTAIGFLGIADPLRDGVGKTVERCRHAGVRLIMLTGDHPATARAVAAEAGLPAGDDDVLTGDELSDLDDDELDDRLEHVSVIARITPLDKVRIVESLKRRGHTVAMTGDGVNDAPALRLADVGVAMGRQGTEVARQASDVVVADDDFATLVESLVEGRGFWQNMRRALALLLGGNLGEIGLMVGASALGLPSPLSARQILAVNLVSDVLPAISVAVQPPEHRKLSGLAREGTAALDRPLRVEIVRRGVATTVPALAAYLIADRKRIQPQTVAFASIVCTQLSQTLDLGRLDGRISGAVARAVGATTALLALTMTLPPLKRFFGLAAPSPVAVVLIAGASVAAAPLAQKLWH